MNVYVTSIGIVSAIGCNIPETLTNLKNKQTGLSLNDTYDELTGAVPMNNEELAQELKLPSNTFSRSSLLGLKAAKEALHNFPAALKTSLAFISATSVGGIDRTELRYFDILSEKKGNSTNIDLTFENGKTTEDIAKELNIKGYVNTISTACSSGANAIMMGARLIKSGRFSSVLVGGTDPLANLNIYGFKSLGVYDTELCRPFDLNRKGLNLGEGAAYLLLQNDAGIELTKSKKICKLTGYGNTADAFHQTASSDEGTGASMSMKKALALANLSPQQIDYINAHGTGTPNNDASESAAIISVFQPNIPKFSSTKCYTGHTLAAAGAIEGVFSVLSIQNDCLFPTFNFMEATAEHQLKPITSVQSGVNVRNVLSNSFGFGGNCTSLIFSKIEECI